MLTQSEKTRIEEHNKIEELKTFFEDSLEKSINYNKTIISIGFVSFFTVLILVKDYINSEILVKISFFILWSLCFYVLWIISTMLINSISFLIKFWKYVPSLNKRIVMILWPTFLTLTILPAMCAFFLLVKALINCLKTI